MTTPTTVTKTKLADVSDLYAAGIDLTEMLLASEIIHEPEDPADAEMYGEPYGEPITDREHLALVHGGVDTHDDDPGGAVVDLLDSKSERCTDLGNARILVRMAGNDVRWCQAMPGDGWMLWDGSKWRPDTTRRVYHIVDLVGEEWRRRAPQENVDLTRPKEEDKQNDLRKKMLAWADKCESAAGIRAMIEVLRSRRSIAVDVDAWDKDPLLVNTPDATYNLNTGRRQSTRRSDHITRSTSVAARLEDCPIWRAFLLRIMGGPLVEHPDNRAARAAGRRTDTTLAPLTADVNAAYSDPANAAAVEMVAFLQRCAGYALTGDTSEQCMFIAYGTGSNGKGVFLNTLKAILGTYAQGAQVASFMDRKAGGIPNDLAALAGARFVLCSEPNEGAPLDEGLIKTVTGQDTVTARFLNREFFDFIPQFKLWMMTNHKPIIKGTDNGIWRRLRLVPFTVTIAEGEKDDELHTKLVAEHSAILRWCIDGLKVWKNGTPERTDPDGTHHPAIPRGLRPPKAVVDASEEYRREMDGLGDFLIDRCTMEKPINPTLTASNSALYASYVEWAKDNGTQPYSHRRFSQQLKTRKLVQDPDKSKGRMWIGVELRVKVRTPMSSWRDGRED